MSQGVNALCHCHFGNSLALMRPRYKGVISYKTVLHLVWHLNSKHNPSISFSLLSSKVNFFWSIIFGEKGFVIYLLQNHPPPFLAPSFFLCEPLLWATTCSHVFLHVTMLSWSGGGWYGVGHTLCSGLPSIPPQLQVRMYWRLYWPVGDNLMALQGRKYF